MRRFVEGVDRGQSTLFPECLEDWICEDNPVRAIDVFVGGLDLAELGFDGVGPMLGHSRPLSPKMSKHVEFVDPARRSEVRQRSARTDPLPPAPATANGPARLLRTCLLTAPR